MVSKDVHKEADREGYRIGQGGKNWESLQAGELLPYQKGRIVNMDVLNDPKLKFVVMSFDEDTGLTEHSAPTRRLQGTPRRR